MIEVLHCHGNVVVVVKMRTGPKLNMRVAPTQNDHVAHIAFLVALVVWTLETNGFAPLLFFRTDMFDKRDTQ